VKSAREALDAWVREVVAWHFDPSTGCPFWLDYAKKLAWDPRREIRGFADLNRFDLFQDEWLRGGPVQRWVPRGLAGKPVFVFETGGTTGIPKTRINCDDFRVDYEIFSRTLPDEFFPPGSNWLMLGPSGPRRLRLAVEHLAQYRGGICFCVDLDPRWVIHLIKKGWSEHLHAYKDHVISTSSTPATTSVACSPHPSSSKPWPCAWTPWARPSANPASPASFPAAPNSRRSGTASPTKSSSTAPT
jgi:hypothetical protein